MMRGRRGLISLGIATIMVLSIITFIPPSKGSYSPSYYYDDFEDGTLNKWNIINGDWEVITEAGGNHIAHLNRSSDWHRILVSTEEIPEDVIIQSKVKGNTYSHDVADTTVGFYSNSSGNSYYWVMLGGGFGGHDNMLSLGRTINNVRYILVENISVTTSNNVWYNVKIRLENSDIFTKIWEVGTSEPLNWQIYYLNANKFGNYLIIGAEAGQNDEEFWFDNVNVITITRSLPLCVDPMQETFIVTINVSGYGVFCEINETLPEGCGYVGSSLQEYQVTEWSHGVRFILVGETTFTYTVATPTVAGEYIFYGTLRDMDLNTYIHWGDDTVIVWSPWIYDTMEPYGVITKPEVIAAIHHYFNPTTYAITKQQVIEVIQLYFIA